jgi:hypothetical protein
MKLYIDTNSKYIKDWATYWNFPEGNFPEMDTIWMGKSMLFLKSFYGVEDTVWDVVDKISVRENIVQEKCFFSVNDKEVTLEIETIVYFKYKWMEGSVTRNKNQIVTNVELELTEGYDDDGNVDPYYYVPIYADGKHFTFSFAHYFRAFGLTKEMASYADSYTDSKSETQAMKRVAKASPPIEEALFLLYFVYQNTLGKFPKIKSNLTAQEKVYVEKIKVLFENNPIQAYSLVDSIGLTQNLLNDLRNKAFKMLKNNGIDIYKIEYEE